MKPAMIAQPFQSTFDALMSRNSFSSSTQATITISAITTNLSIASLPKAPTGLSLDVGSLRAYFTDQLSVSQAGKRCRQAGEGQH